VRSRAAAVALGGFRAVLRKVTCPAAIVADLVCGACASCSLVVSHAALRLEVADLAARATRLLTVRAVRNLVTG